MKRTDYVAIMAAVIAVLLIAGCVSSPQKETSTSTSSAASATPQPQTTSTQTTYTSPQPQTATSTQTTYVSPQPQTTTSTQTTKTKTEQNIIGNKSPWYWISLGSNLFFGTDCSCRCTSTKNPPDRVGLIFGVAAFGQTRYRPLALHCFLAVAFPFCHK